MLYWSLFSLTISLRQKAICCHSAAESNHLDLDFVKHGVVLTITINTEPHGDKALWEKLAATYPGAHNPHLAKEHRRTAVISVSVRKQMAHICHIKRLSMWLTDFVFRLWGQVTWVEWPRRRASGLTCHLRERATVAPFIAQRQNRAVCQSLLHRLGNWELINDKQCVVIHTGHLPRPYPRLLTFMCLRCAHRPRRVTRGRFQSEVSWSGKKRRGAAEKVCTRPADDILNVFLTSSG